MSDEIIFGPWVGGVTSHSAIIKAAVENNQAVKLRLSESSSLTNFETLSPTGMQITPEMDIATFALEGRGPNREYHFALEVNGVPVTDRQGRFSTFPQEGEAATFTFACAGDAKGGDLFSGWSNHEVFDVIRQHAPLFFVHLGDMHYADVDSTKVAEHAHCYVKVLEKSRQARLYREVPLAYTWDDHDYCGNASDRDSNGRSAARLAYQQCVPHYPLIAGSGDQPIYQAFTVGRVRFLLTDTRSERSSRTAPDNAAKTILGTQQKQWLKDELLQGQDRYKLLVWINSVPWIGDPEEEGGDTDAWFSYNTERQEIGQYINNHQIRNILMLSADAHMLALDDGSNNQGRTGVGGFPILQASPLDRSNSRKGKPFSHGFFVEHKGQYGLVTVTDNGDEVQVSISGRHLDEELISFQFSSPRP